MGGVVGVGGCRAGPNTPKWKRVGTQMFMESTTRMSRTRQEQREREREIKKENKGEIRAGRTDEERK